MARCLIVDDSLKSIIESIKSSLLEDKADYNEKIIKGFIASYLDVNGIEDHSELKESDIKAIVEKINRGKVNKVIFPTGYGLPADAVKLHTEEYGAHSAKIFSVDVSGKPSFNEQGLQDYIDSFAVKAGYVEETIDADDLAGTLAAFGIDASTASTETATTTPSPTPNKNTKIIIPVPTIPVKYDTDIIRTYRSTLLEVIGNKFPDAKPEDITFNISISNASTLALATIMIQEGYTVDISVADKSSSKFAGTVVLQTLMEEGLLVDTSIVSTLTTDMLTHDITTNGKENYISLTASNMSELGFLSSTLGVETMIPLSSSYAIKNYKDADGKKLLELVKDSEGNEKYKFTFGDKTYYFNVETIKGSNNVPQSNIKMDEVFYSFLEDYYRKILNDIQSSGKKFIVLDAGSLPGLSAEKTETIANDFPNLDIIKLGSTLPAVQRAKYSDGKSYSSSMAQIQVEQSLGSLIPVRIRKDLEKAVVQLLAADIRKRLINIDATIDANTQLSEEEKEILKAKIKEVTSKNEEVTVRTLLNIKGLFSLKDYKKTISNVIGEFLRDFDSKRDNLHDTYIYKTVKKSLENVPNTLSEEDYIEYAGRRYSILKTLYDSGKIDALLDSMVTSKSINTLTEEVISTSPEEGNMEEDVAEEEQKEEAVKESFGIDHFTSDSMSSVTKYIRSIINTVPITDHKGNYKISEAGFIERYSDREVFNILLDNLYHATSSDQMMELLDNMKSTYPWVNILVSIIEQEMAASASDPNTNNNSKYSKTKASLFKAVRKNKVKYIKSRGSQGKIVLNNESATNVPLTIWKNEVLSGVQFSDYSLYDSQGNISTVHYKTVKEMLETLKKGFNNGEYADSNNKGRLDSDKLAEHINSILKTVGVSYYNTSTLSKILRAADSKHYSEATNYTYSTNVDLKTLFTLFTELINNVEKKHTAIANSAKNGEDVTEAKSFSNSFSSNMLKIVKLLEKYSYNTSLKPSFRLGSKLRSTYVTPNYIGDMMMELRGEGGITKKELLDKIEKRFKYSLFHYRDGQYIGWVKYIVDNINSKYSNDTDIIIPEDSIIDRFHFLANDSNEEWDALTREEKLMHNISLFFSEAAFTQKQFVLLEMPNYSDSGKIDYVRFPLFLKEGRKGYKSYYDEIADSIHSEFLRVNVVRKNYDILKHIKNAKKNYADIGLSFRYFDDLNYVQVVKNTLGKYSIVPSDGKGKSFYDTYKDLFSRGETAELSKLLEVASKYIIQSNLEEFLNELEIDPVTDKSSPYSNELVKVGFSMKDTNRIKELLKVLMENPALSNHKYLLEKIKTNIENNKLVNYFRLFRELEISIYKEMQEGGSLSNLDDPGSIGDTLQQLKEAIDKNSSMEMVRTYIANYNLGLFNMINMTSNDIAAYDSYIEFQKRNKQIHSPYSRLDTTAMSYDKQRHIVIDDIVESSTTIERVRELLNSNTIISSIDENTKKIILGALEGIKVTDGQSYRSLDSYKEIMMGAGAWTPELNRAYYKIKNYKKNKKDLEKATTEKEKKEILKKLPSPAERNMFFQAIKPYTYTHTHLGEFAASNGNKYNLSVGEQHKNSESPVLLMLEIFPDEMEKVFEGTMFKVLSDVMKTSKKRGAPIDVIHTRGAVKVGTTVKTINLKQLQKDKGDKDGGNLAGYILNLLYPEEGETTYVGETSWSDYGIQVETPEHFLDHTMNLGTQISKLIFIDNNLNAQFSLNTSGSKLKLSSSELYNIFNAIIFKTHLIKGNKVADEVNSIEKLRKLLIKDIANNPDKYNRELEKALDIITGSGGEAKFRRPLNDPISYKRISNLIGSYFRSNLASHNVFGGTGILLSPFGFEKKVKMVYGDDGSLQHVEAIVPVYDQRLIEIYGNSEGIIDEEGIKRMEKDDPKMLELIGYRIPTENKYSTVPIKIVGFMPSYLGNAVVLPSDYVEIAGWDFDVDKLYMFRYSLKMSTVTDAEGKKTKKLSTKSIDTSGVSNSSELTSKILDKEVDQDAMNNLILDIFQSIMKNPSTLDKMIIPGGFSNLVDLSKYTDVLINLTSLYKNIPSLRSDPDSSPKIILERLLTGKTPSNAGELISTENTEVNPLSPLSANRFSHANKIGKDMVAVMAASVAEHAVTQQGTFASGTSVTYNGRTFNSFSKVYTVGIDIKDSGEVSAETRYEQYLEDNKDKLHENVNYISKVLASILAAAADNAKQPVLYLLGINLDVASTFIALIKLGYTIEEVTTMFLNPAVIAKYTGQNARMDAIDEAAKTARATLEKSGASVVNIFNAENSLGELRYDTKTKKEGSETREVPIPSVRGVITAMTTLSKLEADMLDPNDVNDALAIEKARQYFVMSGNHFDVMSKALRVPQSALSSLRLDKTSKSAPTTTYEGLSTLLSYRRIYANVKGSTNGEPSSYTEAKVIIDPSIGKEEYKQRVQNNPSSMTYMQTKFSMVLQPYIEFMSKHFPEMSKGGINIAEYLFNNYNTGNTIDAVFLEDFFTDMISYYLSNIPSYRSDSNTTAKEKRMFVLKEFPNRLIAIKKEIETNYSELVNNAIFKYLYTTTSKKGNIKFVRTNDTAMSISNEAQNEFIEGVEQLASSEKEELREFARMLVDYAYYRGGFSFGNNNYSHLLPFDILSNIEGYSEALENMKREVEGSEDDIHPNIMKFIDQYFAHKQSREGSYIDFAQPNSEDGKTKLPSGAKMYSKNGYRLSEGSANSSSVPYSIEIQKEYTDSNGNTKQTRAYSKVLVSVHTKDLNKTKVSKRRLKISFDSIDDVGDSVVIDNYYRLVSETDDSLVYVKESPLGSVGIAIQYDMNLDAVSTTSEFYSPSVMVKTQFEQLANVIENKEKIKGAIDTALADFDKITDNNNNLCG